MKNSRPCSRLLVALLSTTLAWPAVVPVALAQGAGPGASASAPLSQQQLAALVAPVALYPDALLAQVLMASTYPLEVAEAATWQKAHASLSGSALDSALMQQNWDPSVKSLLSFPQALQMMGSQLSWMQQLGDVFLGQNKDVMAAVQALRAKAKQAGALKSSSQQTVSTESQSGQQVIVIQPASPQVVYVPAYDPMVVYGGWPYPAYPPVVYYPPGYVAGASMLAFGVGMAAGAALWGGCHWGGGGSVTINNNTYNQFNANNTKNWNNQNNKGTSNWNHDPQHRGNVPYSNAAAQQKYGGTQRQTDQQRNQVKQQENRDANQVKNQAQQDKQSTGSQQQKQQQEKQQAKTDTQEAERQRDRDERERSEGAGRTEREGGGEERGGGGRRR